MSDCYLLYKENEKTIKLTSEKIEGYNAKEFSLNYYAEPDMATFLHAFFSMSNENILACSRDTVYITKKIDYIDARNYEFVFDCIRLADSNLIELKAFFQEYQKAQGYIRQFRDLEVEIDKIENFLQNGTPIDEMITNTVTISMIDGIFKSSDFSYEENKNKRFKQYPAEIAESIVKGLLCKYDNKKVTSILKTLFVNSDKVEDVVERYARGRTSYCPMSSFLGEILSKDNYSIFVNNNLDYLNGRYCNLDQTISKLKDHPYALTNMTQKKADFIANNTSFYTLINVLSVIDNDEDYEYIVSIVNSFIYMKEQLSNFNINYINDETVIMGLYILTKHYNYVLEDLVDYLINLPFSQGLTNINNSLDNLLMLRMRRVIEDNVCPPNLSSLSLSTIKKEPVVQCLTCNSIYVGQKKCKCCGSKSSRNIHEHNGLYKHLICESVNPSYRFYTKTKVKSLFEMDIEYFSFKKDESYNFLEMFDLVEKIVNNEVTSKFLNTKSKFQKTSCNIDFKREDKIRIFKNNRKYNTLKSFEIALEELSKVIKSKLNIKDLSNQNIKNLYKYPNLELVYKTKYSKLIKYLGNSTTFISYIERYNTIKDIFDGRTKPELDSIIDILERYSKYEDLHNVKSLAIALVYQDWDKLSSDESFEYANLFIKNKQISVKNLIDEVTSIISKGYTHKKTIKYIEEEFLSGKYSSFHNLLMYLRDYKNSLQLLNPNATTLKKYDIYPKDLLLNHDRASFMYSLKKNEMLDENFRIVASENAAMNFESNNEKDKYVIISPETTDDLKSEGLSLSHCVGTYINKYVERRCKIFFLREKDNIDTPLVTIELSSDNRIVQVKGKYNRNPSSEEKRFIDKWADKYRVA